MILLLKLQSKNFRMTCNKKKNKFHSCNKNILESRVKKLKSNVKTWVSIISWKNWKVCFNFGRTKSYNSKKSSNVTSVANSMTLNIAYILVQINKISKLYNRKRIDSNSSCFVSVSLYSSYKKISKMQIIRRKSW